MTAQLSPILDALDLPADAREWVLDLWRAIQVLDDAADGDKAHGVDDVAFALFVRMPMNRFWQANHGALLPVLALACIKWRAANDAEATGFADARSFMWRAGFYDVLAMACHICGKDAVQALAAYGETFADYCEEFRCLIR